MKKLIFALLLIATVLLSILVSANEGIERVEVSKPDSRGIVTIRGQVELDEITRVEEVQVKNPYTGRIVKVNIDKEGSFVAQIEAIQGQELDLTIIRRKTIINPIDSQEPGLKAFSLGTNGGYLVSKHIVSAYKHPLIVGDKLNYASHGNLGLFAAGVDAGREMIN